MQHRKTSLSIKHPRSNLAYMKREPILKYPHIDHTRDYSQRPPGARGAPRHDQLFLVSYAYAVPNLEAWKNKVKNLGFQVHEEPCRYGDHENCHLVVVAGPAVNLQLAIEFARTIDTNA